MKNSKRLTGLVIGLVMGTAMVVAAPLFAGEKVKVGFSNEPYPPFTSTDASGKWVGWEIEIGQAICAEAKLDCELAPVGWDGIIPSLQVKKIDLIIGSMNNTPKRLEQIDFSNKYYQNSAYIVGPKSKKFGATPADLKGMVLGVQVSTNFAAYADKHFKPVVKELKVYQTQDEELQDLAAGRIDAVMSDAVSLGDWLKAGGNKIAEFKGAVPPDAATLGTGIAVGIRKGDTAMKDKINAAIKAIRANGVYDKITTPYQFGFNIYGN